MAESPAPRRAALIYNPAKADPSELPRQVVRLSAAAGWGRPLLVETTVADPGQGATRRALDAEVDAVLVAGGDGTVRAVAEAMRGSGVPLTIVPSGTGNLFARNLGLPLQDPEEMIRATFDGEVHGIDIGVAEITRPDGEAEEHAFVVLAGIGLDAAMIQNTNPNLKKTMGWVAYVDGAARSLLSARPFRIMMQRDRKRLRSLHVQSVLFANCGQLPAGISLIPDASIRDGLLDIALIQASSPFGWLLVWRKVWWDNSVMDRLGVGRYVTGRRRRQNVHYLQAEQCEVGTMPAQPVELDGDEFGEALRMRCRIDAGALLLALPRSAAVTAAQR